LKKRIARRRFLTVTTAGAAGAWAGFSDQLGARMVRSLVKETGRSVLKPDYVPEPAEWSPNSITAAWLGHSTVLINFYGMTILTDPVLGKRVGADTPIGTIGAKRLVAPALNPSQLPAIDLVLLSHAHMDHLDPATLRRLPGKPKVVTAHATTDLLVNTRLRDPKELRWGDKTPVSTLAGDIEVEAFEVRHWGARWKVDKYRGYNGYVLNRGGKKLIFGGDTAWSESFRDLRSKGPFEAAMMPIGAYEPWIRSHCTPEQALRMANDAGANYFLPVHFKTFAFGREGVSAPMHRLTTALGSECERIGWQDVGQTFRC
jgi:L-ascorbate metabolism protein UlaG (beta-lactamase superfamily)